MKRHSNLTWRTPESASLSRATSFNRHNVNTFYDKYESVLQRDGFTPDKIWNVDETGCTTVQKPRKIIAATGAVVRKRKVNLSHFVVLLMQLKT